MPPDNLVIPGPSVVLASGQADIDRAARARRSINTKRWRRDAGIAEIVDYFDRPNKNSIDQLNAKEYNVIVEQANRCRKDFVYAARNYFWITNKDTGDQLFTLWESQELILEELRRLKARGRAQKLIILKARQLGASVLVEALIAWNTMFFENTNAIIVSRDGSHASYLFNTVVMHIYDLLPWWLKPMITTRKTDEGLVFDNPDEIARRTNPGLVSRIDIQAATQQGGIGQGRRISAAHISELADFPDDIAREAIEGDLRHALAERSTRTFAVIESTAKGAGTYYHKLWNSSVALADKASWSTIFLPWFFEKTRFLPPEQGWHPVKPELELRERIKDEWVRCDNEECGRWKEASDGPIRIEDTHCPYCKIGMFRAFSLADGQLRFIWEERINAEKDKESAKEFKQELASTATEAFQISGYQLFAPDIQDYVDRCVRIPQAKGFIDAKGRFHGVKVILDGENRISQIRCWDEHCLFDHRYDPTPLWIWEFPRPGADYCCGADVAEGLGGDADYSVGWMNRIGQPPAPDVHVATYRSNAIDPISFAFVLNVFGRWYNEAMMCIEYNKFDTCANNVRYQFQYPNLFRWKHLDNARDPLANKFHWYTQYNTKPRLWQTAVKRLRAGLWVPRDETFASEIKTFQKEDYEDRGGSHASGFHDDTCVPAGTLVTTSSGIKAIEDIRVGDRVLTHQGRYMPVTNTMSKHEPKRLFRVKAMGRPDLLLTGDHKMLLWKKEIQTRAKINKPFRRKNSQRWKTVNMKQVCWTHYIDPDWISIDSATYDPLKYATCSVAPKAVVDVSNINISLYVPEGYRVHRKNGKVGFTSGKPVHTMRHVTEKIPVDINLLRIMGYFAAEGTAGAHHISFASHDREAPFRDWVMHYLRSLGVHCGVRKSAINGSSVWCSSIPLRSFFCEFGKRENRRLPDWTELLPKEKQKQIIVGYLLGDGCFRDKTRRISAATISRELGRQLWSMSLRCGWATAIKLRKGQNGHQEQWNIIYGPDASREIRALIEKEFLDCKRSLREGMGNRTFSQVRINDGFLVGKITKVEEIPFCGPVYDITVDEDHSFVANGTVVSNCISAMISLYCSHDMDWSEDSGTVVMRSEGTVESSGDYHMKCRCGHEWDTDNPDSYTHPHTGCPKCRNIILSAKRLSAKNGHSVHMDWDLMEREITPEDNPRDYNSL